MRDREEEKATPKGQERAGQRKKEEGKGGKAKKKRWQKDRVVKEEEKEEQKTKWVRGKYLVKIIGRGQKGFLKHKNIGSCTINILDNISQSWSHGEKMGVICVTFRKLSIVWNIFL